MYNRCINTIVNKFISRIYLSRYPSGVERLIAMFNITYTYYKLNLSYQFFSVLLLISLLSIPLGQTASQLKTSSKMMYNRIVNKFISRLYLSSPVPLGGRMINCSIKINYAYYKLNLFTKELASSTM